MTVSWKQRFLALGLLLTVLLVSWVLIEDLWVSRYDSLVDQQQTLEQRWGRLQQVVAEKQPLEQRLQKLTRYRQLQTYLLRDGSPTLAATRMQDRVRQVVTGNGGRLTSTHILNDSREQSFSKVAIRVQLSGRMETLEQVLYTLETTTPLLFIDNLQITSRRIRIFQPRQFNARQPQKPRYRIQLTASFELSGYMRSTSEKSHDDREGK